MTSVTKSNSAYPWQLPSFVPNLQGGTDCEINVFEKINWSDFDTGKKKLTFDVCIIICLFGYVACLHSRNEMKHKAEKILKISAI